MIKKRLFSKIYFGWWTTVVNAVLSGLGGGFRSQGFSALFKPIATDLGLTRAAASVAAGISSLQNGFMFGLAGWLSDKLGPKWVIIIGTAIMGTGLMLMYFINSAWSYYVVWGVIIGGGQVLGFAVAHDKILTDWFIRKRGLALGLRFAVMGIVATAVLPVLSFLIVTQGWRITCLIWSGVIFACIPFEFYFIKRHDPEHYGLLPDGAKMESASEPDSEDMIARGLEYAAGLQVTEFTLRQAMRTRAYWILTAAWVFQGIIFQGFSVHCIPFLTDMGIEPVKAGGMMAMMIFFGIPSRFIGGIITDRFKKEHLKFLMSGPFLLTAMGTVLLIVNQSISSVYIFLILMGFGSGSFVPMDIIIRGRYFGRKSYGSIQGSSMMIAMPITFFAPIYTGWVYDATGSYINAFALFALLAAINASLILLARPPEYK